MCALTFAPLRCRRHLFLNREATILAGLYSRRAAPSALRFTTD
jgi:hypothetical protein